MEELTLLLLAIFLACLLFYLVFSGVQSYQSLKELQGAKRVLFVTSHPDDEVRQDAVQLPQGLIANTRLCSLGPPSLAWPGGVRS